MEKTVTIKAVPGYVSYSSNNSGGSWWLKDEDWKNLEAAGWVVRWGWLKEEYKDRYRVIDPETGCPKLVMNENDWGPKEVGERYLGALATEAYRAGLTEKMAIAEWEQITGQCAEDQGCSCCGEPHYFSRHGENGERIYE